MIATRLRSTSSTGSSMRRSRRWCSPVDFADCSEDRARLSADLRCLPAGRASATHGATPARWTREHNEMCVNYQYDARRRRLMADPIEDIIGDYRAFAAQQRDRLATRGIDITPYGLSHLAYRVPEWDQYVHVRGLIERHAVANHENVWNGRPISLIVPAAPLEVLDGKVVPLIELIPPVHQRVYKMGLEHLGVVIGDTFDTFVGAHKPVLTGQQFQGPNSTPDPVYILFEDFTHVKFYRLSLRASVELAAGPFDDGFHHVVDWVPQRLVTATGPNPLPR